MNREFIRELGSIQQYNEKIAKRNLAVSVECLSDTLSELKEITDTINNSATDNHDTNVYRLSKVERHVMRGARDLQTAVDDISATSKGQFPAERGKIKKIYGVDPRDWIFDPVNIGNCHDCPLHAHIRGNDNKPCGAEVCIVKQLCVCIGLKE